MDMIYKHNISIPHETHELLKRDAELFEIFKPDGRINLNGFLCLLIEGYYESYLLEQHEIANKIKKELHKFDIKDDINIITNSILENVILPHVPIRNTKSHSSISLKPSKKIAPLVSQILKNIAPSESISRYFSRMFISYSEKPLPERERIIFYNAYEKLISACNKNQEISFVTNKDPHTNHEVIPYKMAIGQDESFNYLLCAEYNNFTKRTEAMSYRLNRINSIIPVYSGSSIPSDIEKHLNMMIELGAQYSINSSEEISVKLSKKGIESYKRYYYGRPQVKYIEKKDDGAIYHFACSENQVFLYFRRFQDDDAAIMSPKHLRNRVINFHKNVLSLAYKINPEAENEQE